MIKKLVVCEMFQEINNNGWNKINHTFSIVFNGLSSTMEVINLSAKLLNSSFVFHPPNVR